jgi:hypothetical protein
MKSKTRVEIIAALMFWGGMTWLAFTTSWKVSAAIFIIIVGQKVKDANRE